MRITFLSFRLLCIAAFGCLEGQEPFPTSNAVLLLLPQDLKGSDGPSGSTRPCVDALSHKPEERLPLTFWCSDAGFQAWPLLVTAWASRAGCSRDNGHDDDDEHHEDDDEDGEGNGNDDYDHKMTALVMEVVRIESGANFLLSGAC